MGEDLMHIILLCGGKQSGKTTSATAIYGYHLTQVGAIPNAQIDDRGRMSVVYDKEKNQGIYFDIDSRDQEFLKFKRNYCDKYINHVGFADELKRVCASLFQLDYDKITGTNQQKEELCAITWGNIYKTLSSAAVKKVRKIYGDFEENSCLTNRQFMEVFGTFVCRSISENCHVSSAYQKIKSMDSQIVINTDCRFENEFCIFEKDPDVIKIRLLRDTERSEALSERGLDNIDNSRFDLIVDNQVMSMQEKNMIIIKYLLSRNILSEKDIEVVK